IDVVARRPGELCRDLDTWICTTAGSTEVSAQAGVRLRGGNRHVVPLHPRNLRVNRHPSFQHGMTRLSRHLNMEHVMLIGRNPCPIYPCEVEDPQHRSSRGLLVKGAIDGITAARRLQERDHPVAGASYGS